MKPDSVNGQILNYFELSSSLHSFLLSSAVPWGKIGENKKQMSGFKNQLVAWQWCVNWTVPKQRIRRERKKKSWVVKLGRRVSTEAVCMLESLVTGQHRFSLRINPKCHYLYGNKYAWMCGGWIGIQRWGKGRFEGGSGKKWINSFWMMRWAKYEAITRAMFAGRHGKRNIYIQLFGWHVTESLKLRDLEYFWQHFIHFGNYSWNIATR